MARYPKAIWKPLPRNSQQPSIKPVGIVLHTAVSNSSSLYDFFNGRSAGVESHFYVRKDGTVEQYMDTGIRADCQMDGNSWTSGGTRYGFLSIETWDGGHPETYAWNQAQLDTINDIIVWAAKTHGFPVVKATGAHGHGIGYHQQFSGNTYPRWNVTHSCPGSKRIAQVPGIISRANAALTAPVTTKPTEDAMPDAKDVWNVKLNPGPTADKIGGYNPDASYTAAQFLYGIDAKARYLQDKVDAWEKDNEDRMRALFGKIDALTEKVTALQAKLDGK